MINEISLFYEYYLCIPQFEANLQQHSGTEPGYLTSAEFALAIEKIAPLCNTKVSQVLAEQSIANKQSASISLSNAARILQNQFAAIVQSLTCKIITDVGC